MTFAPYSDEEWEAAREGATRILQEQATKDPPTILYGKLCDRIEAAGFARFEPGSFAFWALLGEISAAEYRAGRGMLTAIVINGDLDVGSGFFECARKTLGCTSPILLIFGG